MKIKFLQISCILFALFLGSSSFAQSEKDSVFFIEYGNNLGLEVPPPPPPSPPTMKEEIFKVVEEMPRFPGCEDQGLVKKELQDCSKGKLMEYIAKHLIYPDEAKKKGVEGYVVAQFAIGKNGKMENIWIVRDLDEDGVETCADATLKMLKKMQSEVTWKAGNQRKVPVKVQYTLPVRFKL